MRLSEIIDTIESFGSDSLKVVGGKYEGGIHLQQIPDEIGGCIYDILNSGIKVCNFLEIGSASGGNVFVFNHFFDLSKIVLIDNNRHRKHVLRNVILSGINRVEFIGDSHSIEVFNCIRKLNILFDIIFVDGDHSYNGVKSDVGTYVEFLNPSGFIVIHDSVACKGISKFVKETEMNMFREYISKEHDKPCGIALFRL